MTRLMRRVFFVLLVAAVAGHVSAQLRAPHYSGTLNVRLDAETNGIYVIERSEDLTNWTEVACDYRFTTNRALSFSNGAPHEFFRARRTNEPLIQFALSAPAGIDLSGFNLVTDSFDCEDPNWSSPLHPGRYDPAKSRSNGGLNVESGITNSAPENGSYARINGKVASGQAASVMIGTNGYVGLASWGPANLGEVQAGWLTNTASVGTPNVVKPVFVNQLTPSRDIVRGEGTNVVVYRMVFQGGDYLIASSDPMHGAVVSDGRARIHLLSDILLTNATDVFRLRTNACATIYASSSNIIFGGLGIENPNVATNFVLIADDNCTNVVINGINGFTGVIYAPFANIQLGGDVNGNDFQGAIVGKRITLTAPVRFHYDESLLRGPMR